jgi:hypothetical protein
MTAAITHVRRWLARPVRTFAGCYLVLGPLVIVGVLGSCASLWYLASGEVRGGRSSGLVLLAYSAVATVTAVRGLRTSGRIRHVVLGVLVLTPVNWVDSFVTDAHMRWRTPGLAILLAAGLAYNLVRFVLSSRREPIAADDEAPVPTT